MTLKLGGVIPPYLVSVDCGVRGCGVAVFTSGILQRATYVRNPCRHGQDIVSALAMAREVAAYTGAGYIRYWLAIETMQIYEAAHQKGATEGQNDLLGVQLVAGTVAAALSPEESVSYRPSEWKGTLDGDHMTERIKERLSETEKRAIERVGELDHNTYDGIGIGLKFLGRLERRRAYARD